MITQVLFYLQRREGRHVPHRRRGDITEGVPQLRVLEGVGHCAKIRQAALKGWEKSCGQELCSAQF